ncbi:ABC-2 type transporter [Corchorus olitorius]|uniref:ABC-2 type transporter n=1 Tax=Corchorus olitorius TaxID=93759 RepID=A0A1R3JZA3_9ROSI|nr:ABC-2 type transporter [Corchorus olitorius]
MDQGSDLYQVGNSFRVNSSSIWRDSGNFNAFSRSFRQEDDEEALKWAAIERLPTFARVRKGLLTTPNGETSEIEIPKLGFKERKSLMERLIKDTESDNERSRALPSFFNFYANKVEFSGRVTYNGHEMNEFVPQRSAAYIGQHDLHIPELTVRETLAFSARCQGVGPRYEMLAELARREKVANIKPDPDIDVFMKAASIEGQETSVITDYIIKVLGLEICADTLVGSEMIRGISGGQRKRVTSTKDQRQYWMRNDRPYRFVTVDEFAEAFRSFHVGKGLQIDLTTPFDKARSDPSLLTAKNYGVRKMELLKACCSKELLLMKRNSFVYIFRLVMLVVMALIGSTIFLRTEMHKKTAVDGVVQLGAMFFCVFMITFNGLVELGMTVFKLPVFYKQRDNLFYPAWVYALPTWILKIPISLVEVTIWVAVTYYFMGMDPNIFRFLKQLLLLLLTNQMASALFRLIAAIGRELTVTGTLSSFILLVLFANCGFVLSRDEVKKWWIWGYWISPMMVSLGGLPEVSPCALVVKSSRLASSIPVLPLTTEPLGILVLKARGLHTKAYWYWIGVGSLIGFTLVFNFLYTVALTYLNPLHKFQSVKSEAQSVEDNDISGGDLMLLHQRSNTELFRSKAESHAIRDRKKGMILPFLQHCITFEDLTYAVDMPQEMKAQGVTEDRLALLRGWIPIPDRRNKALIEELNMPSPSSKDLHFPTQYSLSFCSQVFVCLWKQRWSYWRNTSYTAVRFFFTTVIALMFGTMFWNLGSKSARQQDIFNSMGSMYAGILFIGVQNASSVQPAVDVERTVFYREKAAGFYSPLAYAFAQVLIELPYIFVQAVTYGIIVYSMMAFEWTAAKFLWYIFFMYFTFLYFTFFGMMAVSMTPNFHFAGVISNAFYGVWNLFTGFLVPRTGLQMFVEEVMELVDLSPSREAMVELPGIDGLSLEQRKRLTVAVAFNGTRGTTDIHRAFGSPFLPPDQIF